MILEDSKVFCPDICVYRELTSNHNFIMCSGTITLNVLDVLAEMRLKGPDLYKTQIVVPRKDYQRWGSWSAKDRRDLLNSICQGYGTNLYHMWYRGGPEGESLLKVMDGANRLETMRSFIFDERMRMPNGRETDRLKIKCSPDDENEKASTFEELPNSMRDLFNKHRILTNLFFVLDKSDGTLNYDEESQEILNTGAYSLEYCAEIKEGSKEEVECNKFCAAQFIAFNKGKQNNAAENRRANSKTSGLMSRTIDDICKEFNGNFYGFKVKRADKETYIAKVAYTIWKAEKEFLGSAKGKDAQLDNLYSTHKEQNKKSEKLIKNLCNTVDNLKMANKIYNANIGTITSGAKSFATGDCFTSDDGWLLTSFMFNEIFKNYVVRKDEDYIEIGQMCGDLYSNVQKVYAKVKEGGKGILGIEQPNKDTPQLERLAFDWYYTKQKYTGSGSKINEAKWEILKELVRLSNLMPQTKRIKSWDDATYSKLLDRASYMCRVMNTPISRENCEIHHIVEIHEGGTNDIDNLEALSPDGHAKHHYKNNQKAA